MCKILKIHKGGGPADKWNNFFMNFMNGYKNIIIQLNETPAEVTLSHMETIEDGKAWYLRGTAFCAKALRPERCFIRKIIVAPNKEELTNIMRKINVDLTMAYNLLQ